jgi:hypothetical protein
VIVTRGGRAVVSAERCCILGSVRAHSRIAVVLLGASVACGSGDEATVGEPAHGGGAGGVAEDAGAGGATTPRDAGGDGGAHAGGAGGAGGAHAGGGAGGAGGAHAGGGAGGAGGAHAGGGAGDAGGAHAGGAGGADAGLGDGGPSPQGGLCAAKKALATWSRKSVAAGAAVLLNEIMYHPVGADDLEWIELYNPLGIDVDLSGFHLAGAVEATLPEGTFLGGHAYAVVAANPAALAQATGVTPIAGYAGLLPNGKGTIELWNNSGRLLDTVTYEDDAPWPVIPDGSGASLAKRSPTLATSPAESWTASREVGGTPGAPNFAPPAQPDPPITLVAPGASWRYRSALGSPPAGWHLAGYDDASWPSAPATFFADEGGGEVPVTATFTADNFFALYRGKHDGSGLSLIGRDAVGDWQSVEAFTFQAAADDHLYVAAWEAPGDSGGPQSLIGEVALPGSAALGTGPTTFEWILGPAGQSPGGALSDPPPAPGALAPLVQAANGASSWAPPAVWADAGSDPWGWAVGASFAAATKFVWPDTFGDVSVTNTSSTYALFRSKAPILPSKGATELATGPTTTYFRARFQVPPGAELEEAWIDALVDDGAVVWINGVDVLRLRMPVGPVDSSTLASVAVGDASWSPGNLVAKGAIVPGDNVIAVEVHQATPADADLAFAAALRATVKPKAGADAPSALAFTEVAGAGDGFWIELANRGAEPIDLAGAVIAASSGAERVLGPETLAPGARRVLSAAELGFSAILGTRLFLYTPDRARVLDGVRVVDVPRARPEPGADWRYPDETTPGAPNAFPAQPAVVLSEIMYHPPPVVAADGTTTPSPLEYVELHNRGEVPAPIGGFQLVDGIELTIPPNVTIPPKGYLVVAKDVAAMKAAYPTLAGAGSDRLVGDFAGSLADSGDRVVLLDACGNPVDSVRYADGGRFPALADGGGSSLEKIDARADGDAGEAWAASDEAAASAWQTITYEGVAKPSAVGPDGLRQELVVGLLDAGVVLIDDVSVVEDPAGAAVELVQNGTFESGTTATWRLLGNHRHASVVPDPTSPQNHVLRLEATGPTEHMHNHLETTFVGGKKIANGATYRVSLRAKWEGGSNRLNTRLYFNRLARTTVLATPATHGTPGAPNSRAAGNAGPTYSALSHAPLVPKPGEPVRVSVSASDPDGVASVQLWTRVDDGAPQAAPMTAQGGGRFTALVPGAAASSVVQLWVEAADALGASSAFPARGPASRALYRVDGDGSVPAGLHALRIVTTPSDTVWLFDDKNLMSNDLLGATVIDDDREATYDVGVRLKGSERGRPTTVRVGFGLRFPPDRPFRGAHSTVLVDRSEGVGFGQRELFFNQAMNHAGSVHSQYDDLAEVVTPLPQHVGSAHLQLARFGDLLLDRQSGLGGDGQLFEYELVYYPTTTDDGTPEGYKLPQPDSVVGTSIKDLGDDPEAYRLDFIIKNHRDADDYRGFVAFAKAFGLSGAAFEAKVDGVIDVDEWLRAFAFATLSGAVDNYGHGDAHNGDFFLRPSDHKALYFPHDLDFYGGSPQGSIVASADLAKLLARPERARLFYGHLHDIVTTSYNAAYMAHWSQHLGALLPSQGFASHLSFVAARADWVMNGAPNAVTKAIPKVAFQITTNGGAPFTVGAADVALDGTGWVDVAEVRQNGAPVPLAWAGTAAWKATRPLACGANAIALDALDRHGAAVGSASIVVTRVGAGCP